MKIDKRTMQKLEPQEFSRNVEVAINGLDTNHRRMKAEYRRSFRVKETTVDEVFNVVYSAILAKAEGKDA